MRAIARFNAQADDGTIHEIIEYGSRIDMSSLSGRDYLGGLSELRTAKGARVNDLGDGRFEIVQTGVILRKVD